MKMKKRLLGILLSLVMVLGLVPGMSLTAYAAELPHTFNDSGDYNGSWNYPFPGSINLSRITKIEVLMDIESFAVNGWGQVGYISSDDLNDTAKRKLASFDTCGIKKYTAGDGILEGATWAGVQLVGKGRLLAYTITFNDNSSSTAGDWHYPEYTVPTGLTATVGQTLANVALPNATNGTWTWADGNTSVGGVGTNTFSATFTPNDSSLHTVTDIPVPVTVAAHVHSFTYSVSGATITATCNGVGTCSLTDKKAMLTIVAPTLTYVGQTGQNISAEATITDANGIKGSATVKYYNAKADGTDKDGQELGSAPTDAGKYWAEITLTNADNSSSATAHVVYSIGYAVTFNSNGGSEVPMQVVEPGGEAVRPVNNPTKEGSIFGDWYEDGSLDKRYSFGSVSVTENTTIYAKWGEHRVTWIVGGYSVSDVFTGTAPAADSNTSVNLMISYLYDTLVPGGTFAGWYTETDNSGNVTYTTQSSYPVTLHENDGTINAGNVTAYINTEGATLPTDVTRDGYLFGGWYANENLTGTVVTQIGTTETGVKEYWAKWTTVTANNRTYDGTEQPLVSVSGEIVGGTLYYALGTDTTTAPEFDGTSQSEDKKWSTSIPAKTDAGTYYVWYKVVGDANHSDSAPVCLTVTIHPAEPLITGADLVLNGSLDFRFYVALPENFDASGAHMVFTIHGRNYDIPFVDAKTSADTATQGRKIFSCPVYSIEMAEPVEAVFHYTKGGEDKTTTRTASIKDYLDALDAQGGQSARLSSLIAAVRNYGHYIQPYLARLHDFTVGDGGYAEMPAATESLTPTTAEDLEPYKTKWKNYDGTLLESVNYYDTFDTSTFLNVQVKLKSARTLTATVGGAAVKVTELGGNVYAVRTPGIAANSLGTPVNVVFSAGSTVICDIDVSTLTYVRAVLASRSEPDELAALTAFYNYYTAANAYASN